jgi:hypothetical protein
MEDGGLLGRRFVSDVGNVSGVIEEMAIIRHSCTCILDLNKQSPGSVHEFFGEVI